MGRVNLTAYNNSSVAKDLDFSGLPNLSIPVKANRVSVVRFSIPASGVPFFRIEPADNKKKYSFGLNFGTYVSYVGLTLDATNVYRNALDVPSAPIATGSFIFRGSSTATKTSVYEMSHLCYLINDAYRIAMIGLDAQVFAGTGSHLPTAVPPHVTYDAVNNFFSMTVETAYYNSNLVQPIIVSANSAAYFMLQSLPIKNTVDWTFQPVFQPYPPYPSTDTIWYFLFDSSADNVYNTNYTRITQSMITLDNYANVKNIIISTNLPIEKEILLDNFERFNGSTYVSNQQSGNNVLQNYVITYEHGLTDVYNNITYSSVVNHYRPCKMTANTNIYNITCDVSYINAAGDLKHFQLPPFGQANILLDFYDESEMIQDQMVNMAGRR